MTPYPPRLEKWISARIADLVEHEGPIVEFMLFHAVEGEGGEKLQVFRAGEEGFDDALDVTQAVWDVAYDDATTRDMGMSQRYVVQAWRQDAREPDAIHSFRVQGAATTDYLAGTNSERPDRRGQTSQEMRHTENLHRMLMQLTEVSVGRVSRDLEATRNALEKERARNDAMREHEQELLDRKHERELERAREEQRARRHDEMMGMVMAMGPLLLAKLMGGSAAPIAGSLPASSARDQAIGKFLQNLSEGEVMKIFGSLEPHNQLPLMELYNSYREDAAKADTNKPEMFRQRPGESLEAESEEPRH